VRFNALSPLALVMLCTLFWNGRVRQRVWGAGVTAFAIYGLWRVF
jgi:hypothetical protein